MAENTPGYDNNGYTPQIEKQIQKYGELALSWKWIHTEENYRTAKSAKFINLPLTLLSAIAGTSAIVTTIDNPTGSRMGVGDIIARSLTVIVTILNTLQTVYQFDERSKMHHHMATKYNEIVHDIACTMILPVDKRPYAYTYLTMCRNKIESTAQEAASLNIDASTIKKFKQNFDSVDIEKPLIVAKKSDVLSPNWRHPEEPNLSPHQIQIEVSSPPSTPSEKLKKKSKKKEIHPIVPESIARLRSRESPDVFPIFASRRVSNSSNHGGSGSSDRSSSPKDAHITV